MRLYFSHNKITLLLSVTLCLLILISVAVYFKPFNNFQNINTQILRQRSFADLTVDENNLTFHFNIKDSDKPQFKQLCTKLEVDCTNLQTLSIGLDNASLKQITSFLPNRVFFQFEKNGGQEANTVQFNGQLERSVNVSIPDQGYNVSTDSAQLSLKKQGNSGFNLTINNPAPIVSLSEDNGDIYVSSKLNSLMPILSKLSTIEISGQGNDLSGKVVLK